METLELDCTREHDQLTAELRHFVECVRTGRMPRVTGEDGRDALALADRILASVQRHPWDGTRGRPGRPEGDAGPAGQAVRAGSRRAAAKRRKPGEPSGVSRRVMWRDTYRRLRRSAYFTLLDELPNLLADRRSQLHLGSDTASGLAFSINSMHDWAMWTTFLSSDSSARA